MNEQTHNVTDDALTNLLRSLPPEVAERVRQKYDEDRSQFLQFAQEVIPSKESAYWAKRSCNKCCGRGIIGVLTTPSGVKTTPACSCTTKNYAKWLVEARRLYNASKEQGHEKTTAD